VASITWWDLSDRFAWQNAPAGLVRADLSPKPAYRVLDRLINHLWRTDAAGRTWTIALNLGTALAVKEKVGVELLRPEQ